MFKWVIKIIEEIKKDRDAKLYYCGYNWTMRKLLKCEATVEQCDAIIKSSDKKYNPFNFGMENAIDDFLGNSRDTTEQLIKRNKV